MSASADSSGSRVVVVGAGLAGLRAAETLRRHGCQVTVIGDEPHLPYNRPPLSKEALRGGVQVEDLHLRARVEGIEWRLGAAVSACSLADRMVVVDDVPVAFDGLVVASGIRSRHLPVPGPQPATLRTAEDAYRLRESLTRGDRVLVVGAGFIGCEVAATARSMGCEVTVTAFDSQPMMRPLGAELGAAMRVHHEHHGVTFRLGVGVAEFLGSGVLLADGEVLEADIVLEAVGSVPNTEWLSGNGLDLSDGVLTDNLMRAADTEAPVVAAGDIARFPNPRFDGVARRIEHWTMPTETGRRAGETLAALLRGEEPTGEFRPLPSFWSDQYDLALQSFGMPGLGDATLVEGEWDGDCIVEYRRGDALVGVVGVNRTADLSRYRREIGVPSGET